MAERQARQSKNENTANLVERIALDLDQMDLNEAVEMAANAVVSNNQQEDCQPYTDGENNGGGYQQIPTNEHEDEENTSDEDYDGNQERVDPGDRDSPKNKNEDEQNISVVQALASGVEVAPSEGGKVINYDVRLHIITKLSLASTPIWLITNLNFLLLILVSC